MAAKLNEGELRALREQILETEAAIKTLPKWTQAYQAKGELFLALKRQLREQEEADSDLTQTPSPLEFVRGNPESELAAIDKRLGILGEGPLNEVYIAHRQELRARKEHINERLPYLNVSAEDLTAQIEDVEIQLETLAAEQKGLPALNGTITDSPKAKKVRRLRDEAAEQLARLRQEAQFRTDREFGAQQVAIHAQTQAKDLAARAWKESHDRQIQEMTDAGAAKWEVQKLKEESVSAPPPELVAEFAQTIEADIKARVPAADLSLPI